MERVQVDGALTAFRLVPDARGHSLSLNYLGSDGVLRSVPLVSENNRDVRLGASELDFSDRDHQAYWWETGRFALKRNAGDGSLELSWRVSQSAYQMRQSCHLERVLPAQAPVAFVPGAQVPFRCHAQLTEAVPYELTVRLDDETDHPSVALHELFNPEVKVLPGLIQAESWFNNRWEQNGQAPFYGTISLNARNALLWSADFDVRDPRVGGSLPGELPSPVLPSANGLRPDPRYALSFVPNASEECQTYSGARSCKLATVRMDGIPVTGSASAVLFYDGDHSETAGGQVTAALPFFQKGIVVQGHALHTPQLYLNVTESIHCRKPGAQP
jgi:hypothetical protein